jgi:hypothetical protein
MTSMRIVRLVPASALVAALAGASGCAVSVDHASYIEHVTKRFPAEGVVDLRLETFDGSIDVRSSDQPEVVVDVEKRGVDKNAIADIEVIAERHGQAIHVEARRPAHTVVGFGWFQSPTARLVVMVPRACNLTVRTGDGAITIDRVDGRFDLHSGDGDVKLVETNGEAQIETGDGSVTLDGSAGRLDVRTGDGNVRVSGAPTALRVRTGDGDVILRVKPGAVMAEDWSITTGDGSIVTELPAGFNAAIEADSGSDGHIRSDLPLVNTAEGDRRGRGLRGQLGQGGHTFRIHTGDGTIRLSGY